MAATPAARPSIPSMKFMEFVIPTTHNTVRSESRANPQAVSLGKRSRRIPSRIMTATTRSWTRSFQRAGMSRQSSMTLTIATTMPPASTTSIW